MKLKSWVFAFVLAGFLVQIAQSFQISQQQPSIKGTVTNKGNAQTLAGIRVTLTRIDSKSNSPMTVLTDSQGQYIFRNLGTGQYRIRAESDSFLPQEYAQAITAAELTNVREPEQAFILNFQLVGTGTLWGRVVDESGVPIVGASIELFHYEYEKGQRSLVRLEQTAGPAPLQRLSAFTNDQGDYRLFGIPPDEYYLGVIRNKTVLSSLPVPGVIAASPSPEIYYPKALSIESAIPVIVSSGMDIGEMNVTWRAVSSVTLRGRIISSTAGLTRFQGYLTRPDGTFLNRRVSQTAVDTFEISDVEQGSYNLTFVAIDPTARDHIGTIPVAVNREDINNLIISLRAPVRIQGKIRLLSGSIPDPRSQTPFLVKYASSGNAIPLTLSGGSGNSYVREDGTFVITGLSARDWRISVSEGYITNAKFGRTDVLAQGGVFNPAQEVEGAVLDLTVGFETGAIEGQVVDGQNKPIRSETVTIVPDEPLRKNAGLYLTVPTDAMGKFQFPKVPPGNYRIFAWQNLPRGAEQNADFINKYEQQGHQIHVSNQSIESVQIKLISVP